MWVCCKEPSVAGMAAAEPQIPIVHKSLWASPAASAVAQEAIPDPDPPPTIPACTHPPHPSPLREEDDDEYDQLAAGGLHGRRLAGDCMPAGSTEVRFLLMTCS